MYNKNIIQYRPNKTNRRDEKETEMGFSRRNKFAFPLLVCLSVLLLLAGLAGCGPKGRFVDYIEGELDIAAETDALLASITAAGDYMVQYQEANGELLYRVDILDGKTNFNPSNIRLIAGTGSLFTVCRVTGDDKYCHAGDKALYHYLNNLTIDGGDLFGGSCFTSGGTCKIGGAALAVDAIYKKWQATGETTIGDHDLMVTALAFGEHMIWMRNNDGGFYHRVDPDDGTVDPEYFVVYFNGESLMALLQLYEMTNDDYWLEQAHEINEYMLEQSVTQDHWHAYAFSFFAKLASLSEGDIEYATKISEKIINSPWNLTKDHSTISTATKVEALAAIAQAFKDAGEDYEWLTPAVKAHADFIMDRQLPNNFCDFDSDLIEPYLGGIYYNCEEPYIRVDGLQHWINGAAAYLDYLGE
jgi:hypothetical protein